MNANDERAKREDVRGVMSGLSVTPLPDAEGVWRNIQAELAQPASAADRSTRWRVHPLVAIAASIAAVVVGATAGALRQFVAPSQWSVVPLEGAPAVDGAALRGEGQLSEGAWLETDAASVAQLAVGRIGTAEIGPESRVRLVRNGLTDHRLVLERGSIEAVIAAPPRLFFVETPAALATDLGCAYRLSVSEDGTSRLHVTVGWVELAKNGRTAIVPAGLIAEVAKDGAPGTPYVETLPHGAREALARLDGGRANDTDLGTLLEAMPAPDAAVVTRQQHGITLWHLAQRLEGEQRAWVVRRLAALSPPPEGVTTEGILALDRQMLDRWRRSLNPMWGEEAAPPWATLGRRIWMWVMD
jgi:hypothetical protein